MVTMLMFSDFKDDMLKSDTQASVSEESVTSINRLD
jgi:hypothetical protein